MRTSDIGNSQLSAPTKPNPKAALEWQYASDASSRAKEFAAVFASFSEKAQELYSEEPACILLLDDNAMRMGLQRAALNCCFPNALFATTSLGGWDREALLGDSIDVIIANFHDSWTISEWRQLDELGWLFPSAQVIVVGSAAAAERAAQQHAKHVVSHPDFAATAASLVESVRQPLHACNPRLKHYAQMAGGIPAALLIIRSVESWRAMCNPRMLELLGSNSAFTIRTDRLPRPIREAVNRRDHHQVQINLPLHRPGTGPLFASRACSPSWTCVFEAPASPEHGRQISAALQNTVYPGILCRVKNLNGALLALVPRPAPPAEDLAGWRHRHSELVDLRDSLWRAVEYDLQFLMFLCATDWPGAPERGKISEVERHLIRVMDVFALLEAVVELMAMPQMKSEAKQKTMARFPSSLSSAIQVIEALGSFVCDLARFAADPESNL